MDYKQLAEASYNIFKSKNQWNKQDVKRIDTLATLLQNEIEAELAKVGLVEVTTGPVTSPKPIVDIKSQPATPEAPEVAETAHADEPLSLMQRIFSEDDNAITAVASVKAPEPITAVPTATGEAKRYYVTIICDGLNGKPTFQLFKGLDIKDTDFKTDQVTRLQQRYFAVIDATRADIADTVGRVFKNGYVADFHENAPDWIPMQYQGIWQNRTKLK